RLGSLAHEEFTKRINEIEETARDRLTPDNESDLSEWISRQYDELYENLRSVLEGLFTVVRPRTKVIWYGRTKCPASPKSQALLRLLGWYLWKEKKVESRQCKILVKVEHLEPTESGGCRYKVVTEPDAAGTSAHQVVIRHGPDSALKRAFPEIHEAMEEK